MAKQLTINEYILALRDEKNSLTRRMRQVIFDVASEILAVSQDNVDDTFGGRGAGTSSARNKGRSGALKRSGVLIAESEDKLRVAYGGPGVPYARIHEFGGVIRPKKAKALTIPMDDKFVGRRAGEFDLKMFWPEGSPRGFLIDRTTDEIAYLLVKEVTIPKRPYLEPAVKEVTKEGEFAEMLKRVFGTSSLPYEVKRF